MKSETVTITIEIKDPKELGFKSKAQQDEWIGGLLKATFDYVQMYIDHRKVEVRREAK
jgi:hypothetical protein